MDNRRTSHLTADQVDDLLARYRRTGDRSARNRVVESHLHLAQFTTRRLARGDPSLEEDLRQVALLAVVNAAERYRPGKGASFRTFAGRTIDGELKRHLRDRTWAVRPPRTRQEHFLVICRIREELSHELGRSATTAEIADRTDLTVDQVLDAIEAGGARGNHPLEPARGDDGHGWERPELSEFDRNFGAMEWDLDLADAIEVLDDREREVLHLRFVEAMSQPDIADSLRISQSYVSRIIRGALAKLRAQLEDPSAFGIDDTTAPSAVRAAG